jgi:hypothetical protein
MNPLLKRAERLMAEKCFAALPSIFLPSIFLPNSLRVADRALHEHSRRQDVLAWASLSLVAAEPAAGALVALQPQPHVVLDVGGWGRPFTRADWVLDLMPYETRGLYGRDGTGEERFR